MDSIGIPIDLTGDDETINLIESDNEKTEPAGNQPNSKRTLHSGNTTQNTNKSALRNLRHPSRSQRTAPASRSSVAAPRSEPAQSPASGLPPEPGQPVRTGFSACQPGTASKANQQHSAVNTAVKPSGSHGASSALPFASTGAQTPLPPPTASSTARLKQQQHTAAQQEPSTQPITHLAASSQQQAPPPGDGQPAVSSPGRGTQHPPPLLRDIHAQRQAAAKTQATVDQSAQQTVQAAQQAAQAHSAWPMEQLVQQMKASQQAAQGPASCPGIKGECLHCAKLRTPSRAPLRLISSCYCCWRCHYCYCCHCCHLECNCSLLRGYCGSDV